jgi:hypothetical protein
MGMYLAQIDTMKYAALVGVCKDVTRLILELSRSDGVERAIL